MYRQVCMHYAERELSRGVGGYSSEGHENGCRPTGEAQRGDDALGKDSVELAKIYPSVPRQSFC
eukprot:778518-Amphidinium_carterae.1